MEEVKIEPQMNGGGKKGGILCVQNIVGMEATCIIVNF